jgi:hypothetical protein
MSFALRLASLDDMPDIHALMQRAIGELLKPYLPPDAVSISPHAAARGGGPTHPLGKAALTAPSNCLRVD